MIFTKQMKIESDLVDKLKNLYDRISQAEAIIISGHINPDGDDLGSQLALAEYLSSINKKFIIVDDDTVSEAYHFLPNYQWINEFENVRFDPKDYDLIIIVDSGEINRIGNVKTIISKDHEVINIDHHHGNTEFGDVNIVEEDASCIGELLYYFFYVNNIPITYNMAVDIYVSIVTDTGFFKFDKMHPRVHLITADLMEKGIVPIEFMIKLEQNKTHSYVRLMALALSRIDLFHSEQIAVSHVLYDDFQDLDNDDTDGIIRYIGLMNNTSVYIFIKEKKAGVFTASLRSKFNVDVSKVAANFGGGGHFRAAGCKTSDMRFEEFRDKLIELTKEQL